MERTAFVALADRGAAEALGRRVGAQAGRACVVVGVPPMALLLLGREAGYSVEAVPAGLPWAPPDVLLDLGAGAQAQPEAEAQPADDVVLAQRAAAAAVRRALLSPVSALRGAMTRAAGLPPSGSASTSDGADEDGVAAPLPAAASAMATALRAIARRRLEALLPRDEGDGASSSA